MVKTQHIKRFFTFSGTDRLALMSLGMRVPFYQIALKAMGYQRFQRLFITSRLGGKTPTSIKYAKHQGQLVNLAVGAIAGGDNCLLRSVMLSRRLAKLGYAPDIMFGIGRSDSAFQAHSWVEVEGIVVNDKDDVAQTHTIFEAPNK